MKVLGIGFTTKNNNNSKTKKQILPTNNTDKISFESKIIKPYFIKAPDGKIIAKVFDPKNLLKITNNSNEKVGISLVLEINSPKFSELKILLKDGSKIKSKDFEVVVDSKKLNEAQQNSPSFQGKIYGSIGASNYPKQMMQAYNDFFGKGMYAKVLREFKPKTKGLKHDCNFFTPTDGDGKRFKDYTNQQGGICKPAAILPATYNGEPLKLIHATLINFTKTGLVKPKTKFIHVDKARGSAFAFLEGLKKGDLPTKKPIVFCWGDNFSDINIKKLLKHHEKHNAGITVLGIPADYERVQSLAGVTLGKDFEITGLIEKPKEHEEIMKSLIPNTDKHLGSVGPFVISKQVLKHLKNEYTQNPAVFQNESGDFDFSSKILTPMVEKLKAGEIKNKKGNKMPMIAYIKPEKETWSDLGKTTDLMDEMKNVVQGKFKGLPEEIKDSIRKNVDMKKGVVSTDEKAKNLFRQSLEEYGIEIQDGSKIIVSTLK